MNLLEVKPNPMGGVVLRVSSAAVATSLIVGVQPLSGSFVKDKTEVVCVVRLDDVICRNVEVGESNDGSSDEGSSSGPQRPMSYDLHLFEEGRSEADGDRPCWGTISFPNEDHYTWDEVTTMFNSLDGSFIGVGNCAPIEAEEAPLPSPGEIAVQVWEEVAAPPSPTPLRVAPGMALTGLPAYLEIGGEVPHVASFDTVRGELTITMTPRYEVDWGDGASAESDGQGRPYPGGPGEIVHTYIDTGSVTITVSAFWRATWSLAGEGGDLPELSVPTTGSIQLSVEQRQAVTD